MALAVATAALGQVTGDTEVKRYKSISGLLSGQCLGSGCDDGAPADIVF